MLRSPAYRSLALAQACGNKTRGIMKDLKHGSGCWLLGRVPSKLELSPFSLQQACGQRMLSFADLERVGSFGH